MKKLGLVLISVLLLTMIPPILLGGATAPPLPYTVDGDTVYIDDSNVYLSATPATLASSGWVEFTFTSRWFSGDVDVAWGFPEGVKPSRPQIWKNIEHIVYDYESFTDIATLIFTDISSSTQITKSQFLNEPSRIGNADNTIFYRLDATHDERVGTFWVGAIDFTGDVSLIQTTTRYTAVRQVESVEVYPDWVSWDADFQKVSSDMYNMDTWYLLKNKAVVSGVNYRVRAYVKVPMSLNSYGKYCFAIKRSSDPLSEAYVLDPWWNLAWSHKKELTIHTEDYTVGDLNNFPVLVSLASDDSLRDNTQDDGGDIVFTMSDETTQLDHELESFTNTTGEITAWVRVNLTAATDVTIYMYYGNAGASNQDNPTGVWDSDYLAVWHFNETGGDATLRRDSTSNGLDLTVTDITDPDVDGIANGADEYSQANTDSIRRTSQDFNLQLFTIETWGSRDGTADHDTAIRVTTAAAPKGWQMRYKSGGGLVFEDSDAAASPDWSLSAGTTVINRWHYAAGVFAGNGNTARLYQNGTSIDTDTGLTIEYDTSVICVGSTPQNSHWWDGELDEIRMSTVERTATWINATYWSVAFPELFVTFAVSQSFTSTLITTTLSSTTCLTAQTTTTITTVSTDDTTTCDTTIESSLTSTTTSLTEQSTLSYVVTSSLAVQVGGGWNPVMIIVILIMGYVVIIGISRRR